MANADIPCKRTDMHECEYINDMGKMAKCFKCNSVNIAFTAWDSTCNACGYYDDGRG